MILRVVGIVCVCIWNQRGIEASSGNRNRRLCKPRGTLGNVFIYNCFLLRSLIVFSNFLSPNLV